uniref:Uncharacterized protein n=1 Tax=viral metagenome TaxID=1070528 RepID=A0A6C0M362_9ZZZZ
MFLIYFVAPPKNGESDFPKTRLGVFGTSNILFFIFGSFLGPKGAFWTVAPPENGESDFPKTRIGVFGTSAQIFSDRCTP